MDGNVLDITKLRESQAETVRRLRTLQALQTEGLALQRGEIERMAAQLIDLRVRYERLHDAAANLCMEASDGACRELRKDGNSEIWAAFNREVEASIRYMIEVRPFPPQVSPEPPPRDGLPPSRLRIPMPPTKPPKPEPPPAA